jgi:hypothetical protein
MKKIVLSIAAVMAAAAFAPEASALPVFARQTGMACSACHFQHFPLLNGFGRAFKGAGFTMMGAQGKIEGENLDIPNVLNLGVFTTAAYQRQSNDPAGLAPKWIVPSTGGELSLFLGGRISEFAGFLAELGMGAKPLAAQNSVASSAKLVLLFPVADARVGLVAYSVVGQGAAYSYETLNSGAVNTHKMMGNPGPANQHVGVPYASQYFGTNTDASGLSFVANNTMGFINIGKYEAAGNNNVAGANSLPLTYARVAGTFDLAGFDSGVGIQYFGGSSAVTGTNTKATVIDGQMQGEVAGFASGFYASYGRAPAAPVNALAPAGAIAVSFNPSAAVAKTSFNVAAEMGLIPHGTVQLAFRLAKRADLATQLVGQNDNAVMLGATYELAQNIGLSLHYTAQSGSYWSNQIVAGVAPVGKTATTLLLEAAF